MVHHSEGARRAGAWGPKRQQERCARATCRAGGADKQTGTSLGISIVQPRILGKSLLLFIPEGENGQRLFIRSQCADCCAPQPTIRHEGSCNGNNEQKIGGRPYYWPWTLDTRPDPWSFASRCTQLGNNRPGRHPRSRGGVVGGRLFGAARRK